MLSKRIIACLDVKDGRVVKGRKFREHEDMGDVVDLARRYIDQGADELVFYDITASADQRQVDSSWVRRLGRILDIPFCVAGGIDSVDFARELFEVGADKISINTPALRRPQLIDELSQMFGVQAIVVGIDSLWIDDDWYVWESTGRPETMRNSQRRTADWIQEVQERGAGEIVLNCMNQDGERRGYDDDQLLAMCYNCKVPLIASGGAGQPLDFYKVFQNSKVSGALAAGIFHREIYTIREIKEFLRDNGIRVRI